jgi:NADP-dependent alcohol dehydrogenase
VGEDKMENFTFHNPVKILFGQGQISNIADEIPDDARILVIYGGGSIKQNGVYQQVMEALNGFTVHEFGGVASNPEYSVLIKAVDLIKQHNINFLLAVGGGSVIDGTKFIAAAAQFKGDAWQILENKAAIESALPIGVVLTLPATGSEMNAAAVISHGAKHQKRFFVSKHVMPQFSILDPTVTFSLPLRQVGNGIVDAFTHVMEQYATYPVDAPLQDRLAESILITLIEQGPKTYQNPTDYTTRANLIWCATMALNGMIEAGVPSDWTTHMIGHEITALHGLDHAQTLAIVLPAVLEVKAKQKQAKLLQYAERVWQITEGSTQAKINQAIQNTRAFFESVGLPTRLSAYKLKYQDVASIPDRLIEQGMAKLGEHQDTDKPVVEKILQACV